MSQVHLFIFVHPRPGMSEPEFFRYWKEVHAVRYGQKISQAKRYLIDCREPLGPETEPPLWSGAAEVWLESEAAVLDFISSKEYIEGSRLDEPNFLAFWRMLSFVTTDHVLLEGPPQTKTPTWVKIIAAVKRKAGMSLAEFRRYSLENHAPLDLELPGLRRYVQCHATDSSYFVGESMLDCMSVLWFDDLAAMTRALASAENQASASDLPNFVEMKHAHALVASEHWVVGPESR